MTDPVYTAWRPSRRGFLLGSTAATLGLGAALPVTGEVVPVVSRSDGAPFDFDILSARAEAAAKQPYVPQPPTPGLPEGLTYDLYRQIAFNPDNARWADSGSGFRMHAFHMGWLFDVAVGMNEVSEGVARPFSFSADDFDYRHAAAGVVAKGADLPGVAGFRLHWPLNRADVEDELLAFQGASYFRALGRGNAYGLSARGLAIATATDRPEEFPDFTEFFLQRPGPGDQQLTLYALMDSESVTGAYRFVVRPGQDTVMDVTARLWFRKDVAHFGVAPLTSMYLYSDANRTDFDDFRPQVHDSDGLSIHRRDGDRLWRALTNPPRLSTSHFAERGPRSFGLHQRDRDFAHYQDPEARYQDRPSIHVETMDDWGDGDVRLVEIPTELEIHDNIVAYWAPRGGVSAGEAREYRYRLHWGMLTPDIAAHRAFVAGTRTGQGGVSGVEEQTTARKFVVDFAGGLLADMDGGSSVIPRVAVTGGTLVDSTLFKIPEIGVWRLAIDVDPDSAGPMELMAHVEGYDQRLSETWMYQWIARA